MATLFTVFMTALLTKFADTLYHSMLGKASTIIAAPVKEPTPEKVNGPIDNTADVVIVGMRRYKNGYTAIDNRMVGAGRADYINLSGRNHANNQ